MRNVPLEIVTPERKVYSGDVSMVIVRGGDGDVGIMAGHIPLVTTVKTSAVRIFTNDNRNESRVAVSGGFLEVKPDRITILAEAAELPEEIDVERAQRAKERAERRLSEAGREDIDYLRAELALQRALNRLQVAKKGPFDDKR
ncbi:ATP synthase epsilon chain [Collibacillus ludicampi]|uniref:ATP synthase epsilon chain n=1 Tax=Collibacillus ludicampi TaxID=2771369 RepID=A0AAV4LDB4_9BACL|nr:F0F1 ATP synthase subunit epsilon [Collibacillus ludicampi]GIM45699.1 ATP synthase epsilon chain [Collibacillus ludicampi]